MIVIGDHNWQNVRRECGVMPRYVPYGSTEARRVGLEPVHDFPDLIIPWDDMKERIAEAHEQRTMPIYHYKNAKVQPKSQGATNYCWAYSLASALELLRLKENQPYWRLAPATLGWLVRWRNVGYWLTDAIAGAAKRGIASHEFAPDGVTDERQFEDEWEDDALRNRISEWFDAAMGDEKERARLAASMLIGPALPGYAALNWWGHALCYVGVEWDEREKYNLRWDIVNSHGDGLIQLTGSRGVPDEIYFPRSSTFSQRTYVDNPVEE